jgi:hypothetical protein
MHTKIKLFPLGKFVNQGIFLVFGMFSAQTKYARPGFNLVRAPQPHEVMRFSEGDGLAKWTN